jgi:transglutaminase-like putative cysteine protease
VSGRRALQACMQVLVLLDLFFVHMTGIAGWHWLGPLTVLALGAPLWAARRESRLYRALWNVGVVAFLFVLIQHARERNLASVLEDGLVLAVLCQVHLLNNLRAEQKPDLLFLNAFLVAIIAGFLTRTVGFALGFAVFAPCFVIGLELLSATRDGADLAPPVTRRLLIDGGKRAVLLVALSGLAFLFWPRDFQRKALLAGRIRLPTGDTPLEVGFNEVLELARHGRVDRASQPVMRVTVLEGEVRDVPTLWRGATLGETEGGAWWSFEPRTMRSVAPADERWRGRRGRLARGTSAPGATILEVERFATGDGRLFVPLGARALTLAEGLEDRLLRPHTDGNVDVDLEGRVGYRLELARSTGQRPVPDEALEPYRTILRTDELSAAEALVIRLLDTLPDDSPQDRVVETLRLHMAREHAYVAPGTEGAAQNLDEFLAGKPGHCEFFASALATMLRLADIPCRVVTGYRSNRWVGGAASAEGEPPVLTFETRDAHAWVEVHDPVSGWVAVDASPITLAAAEEAGLWARFRAEVRSLWLAVTSFDGHRRAGLLARARELPGRTAEALAERPWTGAGLATLLVSAVAGGVAWRRRRTPAARRAYLGELRRARMALRPGETPRELLTRARAEGRPGAVLQRLERATREHEAGRYAV